MRRALIITALAAAGVAFGAAEARSPDPVTKITVRYGDLDILQPEGAKALLRRIEHAAKKSCGGEAGNRDFNRRWAYRDCVDRAELQAVSRVNSPLVSDIYGARIDRRYAQRAGGNR